MTARVDVSTRCIMAKAPARRSDKTPRQIVGFSLTPETAAEVKMEAARRSIPLKKLFEEMWAHYKQKNRPKGGNAS